MDLPVGYQEGNMARSFPRAPFTAAIRYFEWDRPREAHASEISAGGLFLRTRELLPEGSFITLRLLLPGAGHAFTVLGKVVHVMRGSHVGHKPAGMGVEFLDIGARERCRIEDYVASRLVAAA